MNKERLRKKHDTTPHPYLSKVDRLSKDRPSKVEEQGSSLRGKTDKDTNEYLVPQCVDEPKTSTPANAQDCGLKTAPVSDNQKKKVISTEKRKKKKITKNKLLDYNLKMLTNHLATDPYFAYAQYVASELRKYDSHTLAFCKKEFAEVLFDADTGTLLKRYHLSSNETSNGNVHYKLKIFPSRLPIDPYFAYSQYIASELRKYDHRTLACVKKAFSDILFAADTGTLKSYHSRNLKHASKVKQDKEECALPATPPTTFLSHNEIDFQKRDEWKDLIPEDGESSINPFQSTDEEVDTNWEDILSDDLPTSGEENDSSVETIDLISLPGTEIADDSSPEIMRLEGRNFSEENISPLEYPRRTIDFIESDLNFSPKLASTQNECSLENSGIFDRHDYQSTKLGFSLEKKDLKTISPDISNFIDDRKETGSFENENSLPSTINAPDIFNFEEVKDGKDALVVETTSTGFDNVLNFFRKGKENAETSFITTINTEDLVDSVFKHPDETNSPNLDEAVITSQGTDKQHTLGVNERGSLNGTLINTPVSGKKITRRFFLSDSSNFWFSKERSTKANKSLSLQLLAKERKKISPKQLFIHSKLSSRELNTSIIRQSSGKYKGNRKKKSVRIFPPNPPKATDYSGTSNQDPYRLTSDESELGAEISIPGFRNSSILKSRKKTPGVKSTRKNKKETFSRSPDVTWSPLSKKEVREYAEYLKTIPLCPLGLQNSCSSRIGGDISSEEI